MPLGDSCGPILALYPELSEIKGNSDAVARFKLDSRMISSDQLILAPLEYKRELIHDSVIIEDCPNTNPTNL